MKCVSTISQTFFFMTASPSDVPSLGPSPSPTAPPTSAPSQRPTGENDFANNWNVS